MADEPVYTILYDCARRRPGCVLIQALGTLPSHLFYKFFGDSNCWLVYMTADMKRYPITEAQLPMLAERTDFTRDE